MTASRTLSSMPAERFVFLPVVFVVVGVPTFVGWVRHGEPEWPLVLLQLIVVGVAYLASRPFLRRRLERRKALRGPPR